MRKWLLWSLAFWILNAADCVTTGWHQRRVGNFEPPSSPSYDCKRGRNLLVVLPVIHGYDNISREKLQYLYTKPPVTVLIEDTTSSPDAAERPQRRPFDGAYPSALELSLRAKPNVISKQNPMRTYETMKKPSSRPLPSPSINHLEPINSDTRYLDVLDTLGLPKQKFFDDRRVATNRKEYEYPISSNSYDFIGPTSQTPTFEYPENIVDSNWKAIFVNYSDSSPSPKDSSQENFDISAKNSTEASNEIISILAQLGYLSSTEKTRAETAHDSNDALWKGTDSNYLSSFKKIPTNYDSKMSSTNDDVQKLLRTFGLLRVKRQFRDTRSSSSPSLRTSRQVLSNDIVPASSTTTESARSRVLRYMLANPRIKSVHELFQIIRNTMNMATSPQRVGKSSKTNTTKDVADVVSIRQEFGGDVNGTSANATRQNGTENTTARPTSLNDVDEPSLSEQASSTRPNGVYFYVDWNSFLNMTPSSGDPISVNFSPKAGNRKFFTPIERFNTLTGNE